MSQTYREIRETYPSLSEIIPLAEEKAFFKAAETNADPDAPTGLDAWIKL